MQLALSFCLLFLLFALGHGMLIRYSLDELNSAAPGTVLDSGLSFGGMPVSIVKLPEAALRRQLYRPNGVLGDLDIPSDFMNNRFASDYAPQLLTWLNSQNQTYNGQRLNFVQAEILGFPPTPVPQTGHVTHEFLQEMGGLNVTLDSVQYGSLVPFLAPYGYNSAFFINDASTTQTHENDYSQEVTNTYSASFTQGFTLGFTESITVGVPAVDSETTTISMQWSFSSTETNTHTQSNTVTDSTTVNIAPYSVVNITCYVTMGNLNTNFSAQVTLTPDSNVGWVFQDAVFYPPGQAWFWFFQTYQTISGMQEVADGNFSPDLSYDYTATGVFKGVAGSTCQCSIYQCPYAPGVTQCLGNSSYAY